MTAAVGLASIDIYAGIVVPAGDTEYFLVQFAILMPAFNELDALQRTAWVFRGAIVHAGRDEKARRRVGDGGRGQISTHGHSPRITLSDHIIHLTEIFGIIPASKEPQYRAGPASCIGLSPLHGGEQSIAAVLLGVQHRQTSRAILQFIRQTCGHAITSTHSCAPVPRMIFLHSQSWRRDMGVGTRNHAEFEAVDTQFRLLLQPFLESIAQKISLRRWCCNRDYVFTKDGTQKF